MQGYALRYTIQQDCDKKRKNSAKIAVAHSILIPIWYILKYGVEFRNLGADYYNQLNREKKAKLLMKKLSDLGYDVSTEERIAE